MTGDALMAIWERYRAAQERPGVLLPGDHFRSPVTVVSVFKDMEGEVHAVVQLGPTFAFVDPIHIEIFLT